jgi:hypothetical protein
LSVNRGIEEERVAYWLAHLQDDAYRLYIQSIQQVNRLLHLSLVYYKADREKSERYSRAAEAAIRRLGRRKQKVMDREYEIFGRRVDPNTATGWLLDRASEAGEDAEAADEGAGPETQEETSG